MEHEHREAAGAGREVNLPLGHGQRMLPTPQDESLGHGRGEIQMGRRSEPPLPEKQWYGTGRSIADLSRGADAFRW